MADVIQTLENLTFEEKRALLQKMLQQQRITDMGQPTLLASTDQPDYTECTLETFMQGADPALSEMARFNQWLRMAVEGGQPIFEAPRLGANRTVVDIQRPNGERLRVLNFCGYNYLGYSGNPEVITAAKQALDVYGLGTNATPIVGGTLAIHRALEEKPVAVLGLDDYGVALFPTGFGTNTGVVSAFVKTGGHVALDQFAHASLVEDATRSGAKMHYFRHNDTTHLAQILAGIADGQSRILRTQLRGKVNIGASQSWIVPVIYGSEKLTFPVNDYLQRAGLLGSPMQFPAAPRGQARVRWFVTSEHTQEQLAQGAEIILAAAERFGFSQLPRSSG